MEKSKSISKKDFYKGYYIELECCMCTHTETVADMDEKALIKKLDELGWKEIDSDEFQLIGHHCGCDYR